MNTIAGIEARREELTAWRHDLHAHPELAYQERRTAAFVAERLREWGLDVHQGIAGTGVIGTLSTGAGGSIGLRADMDALPLQEANTFDHRSRFEGRMHACGHDGHTVMLLAAARCLAADADFSGTVQFIFQPAEEGAGGAMAMIEQGLFERFPVDAVFGMHNWPGLPAGHFGMRPGPIMASIDTFDVDIQGRGAHGALPHQGADPVLACAHVVTALQAIVSRNVDPLQAAVVSVTRMHAGDAYNVIPDRAEIGGAIRCFDPALRSDLQARVRQTVAGVTAALGTRGSVEFLVGHPPVVNDAGRMAVAAQAAADTVGEDRVDRATPPVLGSEDFSHMLERRPGCYVFIGNGAGSGACMLHNPLYDFNDELLAPGASYWVRLARRALSV